ncbi:MAG TPA: molybdopterin-dependent oxidoreductase [Euzebyales bacterium]|nr:molybdopterin-dependent oxidoreductase [Euzebyales bacterium]
MTTTADPQLGQQPRDMVIPRWQATMAGLIAAVAALVAAELVAALIGPAQSPITSIGNAVINLAPPAVKDLAVELLGTADKPVLIAGVLVVLAIVAAATGVLAVRRFWWGAGGVVLLGLVGLAAALADARAEGAAAVLPAVAALVTGVVCLRLLITALKRDATTGEAAEDRRGFLRAAAVVVGSALLGGGLARWLTARSTAAAAPKTAGALPAADQPLPPVPEGTALSVNGLAPLVTPNADFYRIDTALGTPTTPADEWRLTIKGMVDNPMELTYDQLLEYELIEADVTLACVSNEVGGYLVGNARWLGVRLADVLADARVQPGADQLVGRSTDGFTAGSPLETVLDGRDSLIAIGMNGEPLPAEHGFPARIVVPGLYGYVSATKWLAELELTTFDAFDAYWVPRGWAEKAPIKTQSRIDVPRRGGTVTAGAVAVAGVAWAPSRGIAAVEVQVDDGPWQQARLSEALSRDSWRQWVYEWQATEGEHEIRVRATDETGETQTDRMAPPRPDGASGWHTIPVTVRAA